MNHQIQTQLREDAEAIFNAAVQRVMPERLFSYCLSLQGAVLNILDDKSAQKIELDLYDRIVIAAFGKASVPMTASIMSLLGERVTCGLVVTKASVDDPLLVLSAELRSQFRAHSIRVVEAGHPVPDQRSLAAGNEMLALAEQVREWESSGQKTLVCMLISGGGSALLTAPSQGLSLEEKASVTKLLLGCGATIHEINTVRKHFSRIKGGLLARAFAPAKTIALVLSDVMGDDLDIIASGPTVPDASTWKDVWGIFERFGLFSSLPESVVRAAREGLLGKRPDTPKPGDPLFNACSTLLVGTNYHAILEATRKSKERGYRTVVLSSRLQGEAREIAKVFSGISQDIIMHGIPDRAPLCVIAGGETTVTLRGKGKGGRNQEMALSVLNEFEHFPKVLRQELSRVLFLSASTDGNDGPTDAAGAYVDCGVLENAQELGLAPESFLAENDSYSFFEKTGGLLRIGLTGTNVCDIQLLIVR